MSSFGPSILPMLWIVCPLGLPPVITTGCTAMILEDINYVWQRWAATGKSTGVSAYLLGRSQSSGQLSV